MAEAFSYARIEAESSMLRWFMSRHGDAVIAEHPGLLARLAGGPCEVALVFRGDRVAALAAWGAFGPGEAELVAAYSTDPRVEPWEFLFGAAGPLAGAGLARVWLWTDRPAQAKRWRGRGFAAAPGPGAERGAARGAQRLGRLVG
ncbi:MAG: hypothetical protein LBD51_05715 [Bifidobacteriaceae bacterium]|nr:hypothetical protein [Bifidobacteriaceae bacterium]